MKKGPDYDYEKRNITVLRFTASDYPIGIFIYFSRHQSTNSPFILYPS